MNRHTATQFLIVVIVLFCAPVACKKGDSLISVAQMSLPQVNDEFKVYVWRFIAEGKARNVSVDVSKLVVEFVSQVSISGSPYCGQALSTNPPHVQITQSAGCWTNQTDVNKEILIFHELGHALLGRPHLDYDLPNGMWKSLMHSGNQFNMYYAGQTTLRKYYLDELFNINTLTPAFALPAVNSKIIFQDPIMSFADWAFIKTDPSLTHTADITNTVYASSGNSLTLRSGEASAVSGSFSYLYRKFPVKDVSAASGVTLKVKVKTDNLVGGASIVIRADYQGQIAGFGSTQGVIDLTGTRDFTEYSARIKCFPDLADTFTVYLVLYGNAIGTVYFDDVVVTNEF
jgi:hypothetical protein